jgi:DNA-binding winged helix-turn-helix (wHTH) protein
VIWRFGEFELDDERFALRQDGREVELRRRVFDVLRYLVAHRNRLVSKEELLENVWPDEVIQEAVVAQNIAILRRVLGDTRKAAGMIQTVHGRGYRFVADVTAVESQPLGSGESAASVAQPFVGREQLMVELRALLRGALGGRGRLVVLTGEPGIGKTRTAEEIAREARALGMRVLQARCHEGEGSPPYWPWRQIVRAAIEDERRAGSVGGRGTAEGVRLLALLGGATSEPPRPRDPRDGGETRFRLFDDVTRLLARLAQRQPLLIVLDDVHWADEATLLLLRYLAQEVRALPLLVMCTTRELDARLDGATGGLLSSVLGGTYAQRLHLGGLQAEATQELVSAGLGHALPARTLRELHALTEGNPFFVHEILQLLARDASATGSATHPDIPLPPRVREVIGLRLQALSAEGRRVLAAASVIGRELGLAVLEQVVELPRAQLLELLERAVAARILRSLEPRADDGADLPPGRYEFAHALIRESLYDSLSEPERARLHDRVGRALEVLYGVDAEAHLDELAHHYYRAASAGEVERAVDACERAAERARTLLAFEQAVTHYRHALDALTLRLPIDEQRRFALKLGLGTAQFRAGQDGNPALLGAADIARRLGRPKLLAEVVLAMSGWPRVGRFGRTVNAHLLPLLTEALAAPLDDAPVLRARMLAARAVECPDGTSLAERLERSNQALELARAVGDDEARHDALLARVRALQAPEDTSARLQAADELLAVSERLGSKERIFTAREQRAQALVALCDIAGADEEIAACAVLADELRLRRCQLQMTRFRLERAFGDGHFEEIRALSEQAVTQRGDPQLNAPAQLVLFVWVTFARAYTGNDAWFERQEQGLIVAAHRADSMRAHVAGLYALLGRKEQARAMYTPLLRADVLDGEHHDNWLMNLALIAEAAAICEDAEAARQLYPRLLPHRALNVSHYEWQIYFGSLEHFLGLLAELLGEQAAMREHFETALAMNAKIGDRPAVARTSLAYGRALLRAGGSQAGLRTANKRATTLLRDAVALASEIGMRPVLREARALLS